MPKGTFIVIDGTDGSGKGTQTARLTDRLKAAGRDVFAVDFPRYGKPSAYFVERYLRGEYGKAEDVGPYRASTFFALDRYDAAPGIREALERGAIVVSNRYVSANKGHQTAKIKDSDARQEFLTWLNGFEYGLLGIPKPDITVLLHVPADIGFDLIAKKDERAYLNGKVRDIHETDREHLHAAEAAYLSLASEDTSENWKLLECIENDALLPIEEVHERLWRLLQPILDAAS